MKKEKNFITRLTFVTLFVFAVVVMSVGMEKVSAALKCSRDAQPASCSCTFCDPFEDLTSTEGCTVQTTSISNTTSSSDCSSKCNAWKSGATSSYTAPSCPYGGSLSGTTCSYTGTSFCTSGFTPSCTAANEVLQDGKCVENGSNTTDPKQKAVITCANKTYNGSAQTIASCSGGTVHNATQTNVGSYTITCTGDSTHNDADSKTCSIAAVSDSYHCYLCGNSQHGNYEWGKESLYEYGNYANSCSRVSDSFCSGGLGKAVITCSNKSYTGSAQVIASCSGGTVQNATQTSVGNYTITCTGDSTHSDADPVTCKITVANNCQNGYEPKNNSGDGNNYECTLTCGKGYHVAEAYGKCVMCTGNTYLDYESSVVYGGTVACKTCSGTVNSAHTACNPGGGGGTSTEFTVTLNSNGGVLATATGWTNGTDNKTSTKTFTSSSTLGTLPTATKERTTFKEWNTKTDGTGTKYTSESTVSSAITLYAIWADGSGSGDTENNNKLVFDCNGGTGSMDPLTVKFGESVTLTQNACVRENYTFRVWKAYAKGSIIRDSSGKDLTFADKASFTNTYGFSFGDITLVAQWDSNSDTYVVHFNANGGSGSMADLTATKGTEGTLPANTFTYKGYTFNGWKAYITNSSGKYEPMKDSYGNDVTFANKAKFTDLYGSSAEEVTLFAQWKSNTIVNPATGILRPTIIVVILLAISGLGYYVVKKKGMSF